MSLLDPFCPLDADEDERSRRRDLLLKDICPDCDYHVDSCHCDED